MENYAEIVNELVEEFEADTEEVRRVITDAAELFRDEYRRIVGVAEDDRDKGELDDFYKELHLEVVEALKCNGML